MARRSSVKNTPENTRKGLNPPWRPGQSGNPKGRPRGSGKDFAATSALKALEFRRAPDAYAALFDRHGVPNQERTYGMLRALLTVSLSAKNPAALKEWAERVEGKVAQPVSGPGGAPLFPGELRIVRVE